jgi:hypothetical protein
LSVIGAVRTPAISRNSPKSCAASSTLAWRLRQIPKAASNIAIGEVIGERAVSNRSQRIGFRFAGKNGDNGGGIDKRHAFPLSSSWNALSASIPVASRLSTRS